MTLSTDTMDQFANALQLSIRSPIERVRGTDDGLIIKFTRRAADDPGWTIFERLVDGEWRTTQEYLVRITRNDELHTLEQFMLISRLQPRHFETIAAQVPAYRPLLARLGVASVATDVETIDAIAQHLFHEARSRGLTLRQLAEQSGLSAVAISNFKSGKDIRLSNFLRLASAAGLRVWISSGTKTAQRGRGRG